MDEIKAKLNYILNTVQDDTLESKKPIILVTIAELIEDVKDFSFSYKVIYYTEKHQTHFYRYISLAKRQKAKLITDLEEILSEMKKKQTNVRRVSTLIQTMIRTELYTSALQKHIDGWVNTTNYQNKKHILFVK